MYISTRYNEILGYYYSYTCIPSIYPRYLGLYGYGSKLGTPKLWMVNTKLDIHICGPTSVFHFDPHPYGLQNLWPQKTPGRRIRIKAVAPSTIASLRGLGTARTVNVYSLRTGKIHHAIFMGKVTMEYWSWNINGNGILMEMEYTGWWCNNHLEKYESQWAGWHPVY